MACSDYSSQNYDGSTLKSSFIAHNEDNQGLNRNKTYLVLANVSTEIPFVSYGYSGEILSQSLAFNNYGIWTSNYVGPQSAEMGGYCRNLIGRQMTIQRTLNDIMTVSAMNGQCSGHNYQIGEFGSGQSVNSEVAMDGVHCFTNLSMTDTQWLFHANMYIHLNISQYSSASSIARENRAQQLGQPQNLEDAMDFLGDQMNESYPIYKSGQFNDYTLHTLTADLMNGHVNIYANNPTQKNQIYACQIQRQSGGESQIPICTKSI